MTSREVVRSSLYFENPPRYAYDFPEPYGTDFYLTVAEPFPDWRPSQGIDNWGCVWENMGTTTLGEVKDHPLKDWKDFDKLILPKPHNKESWDNFKTSLVSAGEKYKLGMLSSLYERVHFVRGIENTWSDIFEESDNLKMFVGLLADINIEMIKGYSEAGIDGILWFDDWGLQDRLMIDPMVWREIWKPEYKRVYDAAHRGGMDVWLHSCGNITSILGDLVEIGLNAIHMDQQMNMGLERLGSEFRGRLTFFSPVDIQMIMPNGTPDEIRAYCRKMSECLGTKAGGFIPRWYTDPAGAGHTRESIDVMCKEFLKISREIYGN